MAKYMLTKVAPVNDEPGMYTIKNYEFRSLEKLIDYASECLRRLISFEINQVAERRYVEICSYNFFDELGLMFSESCPKSLKYKLSLVSRANGIYTFSGEEVKE